MEGATNLVARFRSSRSVPLEPKASATRHRGDGGNRMSRPTSGLARATALGRSSGNRFPPRAKCSQHDGVPDAGVDIAVVTAPSAPGPGGGRTTAPDVTGAGVVRDDHQGPRGRGTARPDSLTAAGPPGRRPRDRMNPGHQIAQGSASPPPEDTVTAGAGIVRPGPQRVPAAAAAVAERRWRACPRRTAARIKLQRVTVQRAR